MYWAMSVSLNALSFKIGLSHDMARRRLEEKREKNCLLWADPNNMGEVPFQRQLTAI
jgi:hypothetical protein